MPLLKENVLGILKITLGYFAFRYYFLGARFPSIAISRLYVYISLNTCLHFIKFLKIYNNKIIYK